MNATEKLRHLLDERGIDWWDHGYANHTWWSVSNDVEWCAENRAYSNGLLVKIEAVLTPKQAIEATLGRGTCRNSNNVMKSGDFGFRCSECGAFDDAADPMYCHNCGRKVE